MNNKEKHVLLMLAYAVLRPEAESQGRIARHWRSWLVVVLLALSASNEMNGQGRQEWKERNKTIKERPKPGSLICFLPFFFGIILGVLGSLF